MGKLPACVLGGPEDCKASETCRDSKNCHQVDVRQSGAMTSPIPHNWEVPQSFRDRLGAKAGRQRAMIADEHLLLILHAVPSAEDPAVRAARLFWRKPDGTWRSDVRKVSTIDALQAHVHSYLHAAEALEERVEAAITATEYFRVVYETAPLLHSARNMTRALQAAREAVPADKELIGVRDSAQEVERALELIHGYAKDGLEFTGARNAEESAKNSEHVIRSGHQLNLLAAVFLPITALGSLLGMNLVHGFETWHAPYTFWVVSALSFGLGFWLKGSLPRPPSSQRSSTKSA
jgi:Mg2+ and Co2+ transporter CorA